MTTTKRETEVQKYRAMLDAQVEAREHDIMTINNLGTIIEGMLKSSSASGLPKRKAAKVRAAAREQLRRLNRSACGCDDCLAAAGLPPVSTLLLSG